MQNNGLKSFRTDILPYIIIITKKSHLKFSLLLYWNNIKKEHLSSSAKNTIFQRSTAISSHSLFVLLCTRFMVCIWLTNVKCVSRKQYPSSKVLTKGSSPCLLSRIVYNTYLKWQSNQRILIRGKWELVIFIMRVYYKHHFYYKNKDKWVRRPSRKFSGIKMKPFLFHVSMK